MKAFLAAVLFSLSGLLSVGQTIYSKAFGDKNNKPIIFLHGGPGYNCANFEATTAQSLADNGFYVIVYDRRGEGRSTDPKAQFTFNESMEDINALYTQYGITKSTLIGHSFGGVIATRFAEKYPNKVQSIILVGAPIALQETYQTIIATSRAIYASKKDSVNLGYLNMLSMMDKHSLEYSSYCLVHAMQNGFYSPKNPTDEAKKIYATFKTDTLLVNYASQMNYAAPQGYWKNEKYTSLDLTTSLKNLKEQNIAIYGLYGKDDGLYSADQINALKNIIGDEHLDYLDRCSHNVFIDQQATFLTRIETWTK